MLTWPPGPRPRAGPIGASLLPALSPEPPRFIKEPKDQIGVSGGVASFVCQATGDPKPRVTWNKKGKKVNSQRFEVSRRRGRGGQPGASTPSPRGDHGGSHRRRHRNGPQVSRGSRGWAPPQPGPCSPPPPAVWPQRPPREALPGRPLRHRELRGLEQGPVSPRLVSRSHGPTPSTTAHRREFTLCTHTCDQGPRFPIRHVFSCLLLGLRVCGTPLPHTHTRCPSPVHIRAWFSASVRLHRTPTDRHAPSPSPGGPGTPASPALCPSPRQTIEFDGSAGAVLRIQPLRTPRDENVYECVAQNAAGEITVHAKLTVLRGTVVPGAGSGRGGRHRAPALGTHLRRHLLASGFGFSLWGALGRPSPARDAAGPGTCWQGLAAPWGKGEHGGTEVTPLFIFIVLFRF